MRLSLLFMLIPSFIWGQKNVLHYDETEGFDHRTRDESIAFFKTLEDPLNITVTQDSDGNEFTMEKLGNYNVVIFSNTSGINLLNESQQDALEWFIDTKGGGLIGIHAATDTYRHSSANGGKKGQWDWYAETLGGSVQNSPNHTSRTHVNMISSVSGPNAAPVVSNLVLPWQKQEEYYYWENGYLNADIEEILRVGDTGPESYDDPRPVAWQRTNTVGARIFYTSLGHDSENFEGPGFPQFRILLRDALLWTLGESSIVPVEYHSFQVDFIQDKQHALVGWSTSLEINAERFEVERSHDGLVFEKIGSLTAFGGGQNIRNYTFIDRLPLDGISYYRLKQIDVNGDYQFTKTIPLEIEARQKFLCSPNPTYGILNITSDQKFIDARVQLFNKNGKLLESRKIDRYQNLSLDLANYPAGLYYLEIIEKSIKQVIKVVKI